MPPTDAIYDGGVNDVAVSNTRFVSCGTDINAAVFVAGELFVDSCEFDSNV